MEFAVIKTGGKQYKVTEGQTVKIEKLKGDFKKGDKVTFEEVLALDNGSSTELGSPTISGKKIDGIIESVGRNQKVVVVQYKSKSNYHKKYGHRQPFFKVKIGKIA
ncbi:MAG: 50S ribosomal protein L21 [Bacteroidetes bacterium]|nr:50S ribosomal protein L21 [Bacteroidota bacterium]